MVSHFMAEAERLCDRVALIDAGQVLALDTPAGLTERIRPEQRIQFRPSVPLRDELLTSLPEARRSVDALRPEPLETARLSDALAAVAERWSALHGITVQVSTPRPAGSG